MLLAVLADMEAKLAAAPDPVPVLVEPQLCVRRMQITSNAPPNSDETYALVQEAWLTCR